MGQGRLRRAAAVAAADQPRRADRVMRRRSAGRRAVPAVRRRWRSAPPRRLLRSRRGSRAPLGRRLGGPVGRSSAGCARRRRHLERVAMVALVAAQVGEVGTPRSQSRAASGTAPPVWIQPPCQRGIGASVLQADHARRPRRRSDGLGTVSAGPRSREPCSRAASAIASTHGTARTAPSRASPPPAPASAAGPASRAVRAVTRRRSRSPGPSPAPPCAGWPARGWRRSGAGKLEAATDASPPAPAPRLTHGCVGRPTTKKAGRARGQRRPRLDPDRAWPRCRRG